MLLDPSAAPADLRALTVEMDHRWPAPEAREHQRPDQPRTIATDTHGDPWLPGQKRPLPPASQHALDLGADDSLPDTSASSALWRFLIGAANAHWHLADVAAYWHSPGLEHVRTTQEATERRSRPTSGPACPQAVLALQWRKAVRWAAENGVKQGQDDPSFPERCAETAAVVSHWQTVADRTPGRWADGRGPTARRVLDALHLIALQANTSVIATNHRRLAELAGIGRSTADRCLSWLAGDGLISVVSASGEGTVVQIPRPPTAIHSHASTSGSQADLRPHREPTTRQELLDQLHTRLDRARHDLYGPRGIPHHIGNIAARLHEQTPEDQAGIETSQLRPIRKRHPGLIRKHHGRWDLCSLPRRNRLAQSYGVAGRLAARTRRYRIERVAWDWWNAELAWMKASRDEKSKRGQLTLLGDTPHSQWPAHPRTADHRADYHTARTHLEAIDGQPEHLPRQLRRVPEHDSPTAYPSRIEELHTLDPPIDAQLEDLANSAAALDLLKATLGAVVA